MDKEKPSGLVVFSEGAKVGNKYCVITIHDDAEACKFTCLAYDPLEAETYRCELTYRELEVGMAGSSGSRCAWITAHLELTGGKPLVLQIRKDDDSTPAKLPSQAELSQIEEKRQHRIQAKEDAFKQRFMDHLHKMKLDEEVSAKLREERIAQAREARKDILVAKQRESASRKEHLAAVERRREERLAQREQDRKERDLVRIRMIRAS